MPSLRLPLAFFAFSQVISAVPIQRDEVSVISLAEINSYRIYAQFARVGYCPSWKTENWSCGEASNDILDFTPYAVGGDGGATPYWYVGYHAGSHSVIVGNQGSDFEQLEAFLTNANFFQNNLNSTLFPGVSTEAKAHGGFVDAQATSADAKLAAVQSVMASSVAKSITLTGHSLGRVLYYITNELEPHFITGGAISLLDALHFSLILPSASLKVVTHGLPRVGNKELANLIHSMLCYASSMRVDV
ncbi:Lipase (class 3), partial [Rhizoctonia solani]